MKKLVLFFTTMCITLSAWAYHFQVDGIYYNVTSSVSPFTVGVTSGEAKYTGEVSIPATVVYSGVTYSVTAILGSSSLSAAFSNCTGLTSVTIPSSVTSIGNGAFYRCSGLTSITIPSSVTTIGEYAFSGCSGLTSITIPSSVTTIGESAFSRCSGLTSVTIPSSVTTIGGNAFSNCTGLTSVTIPSSVTEIGSSAFSNCTGLATVTNHSSLVSIGNNAFTGTAWYNIQPDGVVYVGKVAYVYKGTMPANTNIIFAEGTTSVANGAFSNQTNLTSITIPSSVTSIGESAFSGCSGLTSVTIPSSVTAIGGATFSGCSGLTSVTIPSSVTEIGDYAFFGCAGLTSVTIPSSVTSIGYRAFNETGWYYKQPAGLVYAGKVAYTYKGTMLYNTNLTIADGTVGIAGSAFESKTGLVSVTIPSSVTSIGHGAFYRCSGLTSVTIPSSVTSLEDYTFSDCTSLTEVIIPSSVTSIGNSAFSSCSGLTSVTIPSSVTSIGTGVFTDCNKLTNIISLSYSPFSGLSLKIQSLVITGDSIDDSVNNNIPNSYRILRNADIKGAQNKVLPVEMFYNCFQLENLKLPSKLERIGYKSVSDCILLKEISIPSTVTEIEMRAFENCRSLQKVVFEEGSQLKAICNWAFYACHALEDIVIPTGVTTIGDGAFWSCDYLKKLSIPSSVSAIGDNAFEGCKTLGSIQVEAATPPQVSGNTFNGVSKSIPVKVPKGSIDQYRTAFGWKDFAYLTETGMDVQQPVSFNCYVENGTIVIGGVKGVSRLVVSDLQGKQLCNRTVNSETTRVELAHRGVYMVSVGGKAVKVLY